jgi:hypothetical protein
MPCGPARSEDPTRITRWKTGHGSGYDPRTRGIRHPCRRTRPMRRHEARASTSRHRERKHEAFRLNKPLPLLRALSGIPTSKDPRHGAANCSRTGSHDRRALRPKSKVPVRSMLSREQVRWIHALRRGDSAYDVCPGRKASRSINGSLGCDGGGGGRSRTGSASRRPKSAGEHRVEWLFALANLVLVERAPPGFTHQAAADLPGSSFRGTHDAEYAR